MELECSKYSECKAAIYFSELYLPVGLASIPRGVLVICVQQNSQPGLKLSRCPIHRTWTNNYHF
jgi:hypothetical protein